MKRALAAAALLVFALASPARTTLLHLFPSGVAVFDLPVHIEVPTRISAAVEIKPKSLELTSKGKDVTARVEFSSGFTADGVDRGSVLLCLGAEPCATGVPADENAKVKDDELRLTFDRAAVLSLLQGTATPSTVTLTVSGLIGPSAIIFFGTDSVDVRGGKKDDALGGAVVEGAEPSSDVLEGDGAPQEAAPTAP